MSGKEDKAIRRPSVIIHAEQCKGCGRCVVACPNSVLIISEHLNSHGMLTAAVAGEGCTGCGICYYNCPEPGAITVHKKIPSLSRAKE